MNTHRGNQILLSAALGAGLLTLALAFAGSATADDDDDDDDDITVVYPTGDPSDDVPNVQDAVAGGGTVLLKATDRDGNPTAFNFGQVFPATLQEAFDAREENSVNIRRSVRIRGESLDDDWAESDDDNDEDLDDEVRTTLEGGFEPFHIVAPGIDVVIEGIDFTCTRYKAISVKTGDRVVIRNNRFGKVTFFQTDSPPPFFPVPRTFGIAVADDTGQLISVGTAEITGNLFDLNPDPSPPCPLPEDAFDPDPSREKLGDTRAFAFIGASVDGTVIVRDNTIRNTARLGVNFLDPLGKVEVRDNVIDLGPLAASRPLGNLGIQFQPGFFPPFDQEGGRALITGNKIICSNPDCRGIAVGDTSLPRTARAIVKHNHIVMAVPESETPVLPFAAGIELFMSNSVVSDNRIEGRSNFAILVEGDFGDGVNVNLANDNRIVRNKVRDFTPLSKDYFGLKLPEPVDYALFDGNDNRLRGRSGTVCLGGFTGSSGNVVKGGLEVVVGDNCQ